MSVAMRPSKLAYEPLYVHQPGIFLFLAIYFDIFCW